MFWVTFYLLPAKFYAFNCNKARVLSSAKGINEPIQLLSGYKTCCIRPYLELIAMQDYIDVILITQKHPGSRKKSYVPLNSCFMWHMSCELKD